MVEKKRAKFQVSKQACCATLVLILTMADPVEEASKLPLREQLEHSHWKVRSNAYEEVVKRISTAEDDSSPIYGEIGMHITHITYLTEQHLC